MKAGSKSEARRKKQKAAPSGLPELAATPKRVSKGNRKGCFVERTRQQGDREVEPRTTVLSARARQLGKDDTEATRLSLTDVMFGDAAGQAIMLGTRNKAEAHKLWDVFCKLDQADATYHSRILRRSRHAKCGKIEYFPERFEIQPDTASDARTDEEKDRSAVNGWMRWHGLVGRLASHERSAIWDGIYLRCDLQRGGFLTTGGKAFVAAMRLLVSEYEMKSSRG